MVARTPKAAPPQAERLSEMVFDPGDRRSLACLLHAMRRLYVPLPERRVAYDIVRMHCDRTLTLIRTISEITAKMQRRHKQALRIWGMLRADMDVVAKMRRHHKETLHAALEARSAAPGVGGPETLAFEPCGDPGWDQWAVLLQGAIRMSARLLMGLRRWLELQARHPDPPGRWRVWTGRQMVAHRLLALVPVGTRRHMPA